MMEGSLLLIRHVTTAATIINTCIINHFSEKHMIYNSVKQIRNNDVFQIFYSQRNHVVYTLVL